MATSNTDICNMALGKIGSKRITNFEEDTSPTAESCRLHFEQTRDSLIRSHYWRFAAKRATLAQDATDPDFEYDNQFILPIDFLLLKSIFGDNSTPTGNTRFSFAIEGQRLLTNEDSVEMRYIRKVVDPTEFDSLFVEVLILQLALKLVASIAGGATKLQKVIQDELFVVMRQVRAADRQETNTIGRANRRPWLETRLRGGNSGFSQSTVGSI